MKILGIPRKDKNLGSTRIRFYSFMENLPSGWEWEPYRDGVECDAIYIQKLISPDTIRIAKAARARGIPVVYDRDDFKDEWCYDMMVDNVDVVTTDTEANAEIVRKHSKTPVVVVSDCLDYGVAREDRALIRSKVSRVVTYGRQANVRSIAKHFAGLSVETAYFCDRKFPSLKRSTFIEWNRKTFIHKLGKFDAVVLTHDDSYRVPAKPNTRMVVAMSVGLPVLATPSPAFERTLEETGHPELLITKKRSVGRILKDIASPESRQSIGDVFFEYAWKNYRPELSAAKLVEVICDIKRAS